MYYILKILVKFCIYDSIREHFLMMIKTIGIFLLLNAFYLSHEETFAQTQPWRKLQTPVNVLLRNLVFVDSLTGWAAGELGTIIRTTDGGQNWVIQNSTVQTFIIDIFFVDKNNGWALTIRDIFPFNMVILKTTNGGDDWSAENFPDSSALMRAIFFFDSLNGFIGGSYIAYTSDGGNNWTKAQVDSNMVYQFPVYKFKFYNRQSGYACGGRIDIAGVIWRTTNYGFNWIAQPVSPDEVFDIFIFDSLNAITLSGDPEGSFGIANIKTTDAGLNWSYDDLPFTGLSYAIDFRTYNEGWSASGYTFLLTTNRGETWEEFETPDSTVIYDLQFVDERTGYAAGQDGVILKTFYPPTDTLLPPPDMYILYQNYPNPFSSSTKIKFTIPQSPLPGGDGRGGLVTLKVYDVLGNEIATLVNGYKSAGGYEVEFSVAQVSRPEIASGVYFYQLRVTGPETSSQNGRAGQGFIQTKKMVLLR